MASPQAAIELDREACRRSLSEFVKRAWRILEPTEIYSHNWHIDAVCEHLEAITRGEFNRFLCNIPPGTMKSLLISVFWPAWEWGPMGMPSMRYMFASHELNLSIRDSRKMRLLVQSDWFQQRWPIGFAVDQNQKTRFENDDRGFRLARAIKSLTGDRAHRLGLDDPHSVDTAESDVERAGAVLNFREAANSRLVSPKDSAIVVVMQRLNEGDISGEIIESIPGYVHLMLPMEYEPDRRCVTPLFADPRTEPGELLFPDRFPQEVIDRDKPIFGEYAWAGQMQQRPAPRDGGLFKVGMIEAIDRAPECDKWVRAWDLAGSREKTSPWTAGVLMGRHEGGYCIADVQRRQWTPGKVKGLLLDVAEIDGTSIMVRIPQDPGQAGKAQVADLKANMDGFYVKSEPVTGDKETRATPFATQVEAGRVQIVKGPWNKAFLAELETFPAGRFADQVDAASDAYAELIGKKSQPRVRRA